MNGKPLTATSAVLQIIRMHICFEALFVVPSTNRVMSFEECVHMMNRHIKRRTKLMPINGFDGKNLNVPRKKEHRKAFQNIFNNPKTGKRYDVENTVRKFCCYYSIMKIFYTKSDGSFRTISEVFDDVRGLLDYSFSLNLKHIENLRNQHVEQVLR